MSNPGHHPNVKAHQFKKRHATAANQAILNLPTPTPMTDAEDYARSIANDALLTVDAKDQQIWRLEGERNELRTELGDARATIAELRVQLVDHQTLLAEARQRAQEHGQAIEVLTRRVNRLALFAPKQPAS